MSFVEFILASEGSGEHASGMIVFTFQSAKAGSFQNQWFEWGMFVSRDGSQGSWLRGYFIHPIWEILVWTKNVEDGTKWWGKTAWCKHGIFSLPETIFNSNNVIYDFCDFCQLLTYLRLQWCDTVPVLSAL